MKRIVFLPLLLILALTASSMKSFFAERPTDDKDYSLCLKKYDSRWGEECSQCSDSHKSYRVFLRNSCTDIIDAKVAVQETDKHWKTYTSLTMNPNDTLTAYACVGTGKYRVWAKRAGDKLNEFPSDAEINAQYSK